MNTQRSLKVVITGGPGGGKTTAIDLFRRELCGKVSVVSEAATLIFASGIERTNTAEVVKATQKAIFNLQKDMEAIVGAQHPDRLLICDRGTLDGLAYWPGSEEEFFQTMNTTYEEELARYDAVIFFETGAASGNDISSNNPYRNESAQRAVELDEKLQRVWSKHPKFSLVSSNESFVKKIMYGIMSIENVINSIK